MVGHSADPRAVSVAIFNNASFAEVLLAVDRILEASRDDSVTTRQVAAATGRGDSVIRPVMMRLVAAGLIEQKGESSTRGPKPFRRLPSKLWAPLLLAVSESSDLHTRLNT